jgi:hypothetical protein
MTIVRRSMLAATAALALVGGAASAQVAHAAPVKPAVTALPAHVFAPYFEAYNGDSLSGLSSASGAKDLSLAFFQVASKGSCTVYWNGDTSMPISVSTYGSDINTIRAAGGDVIPSFGGYSADNGGTDIADSCTTVTKIAAAYEKVITTYNVSRIDLDTEDNSLTNGAGITRRNQAIAQVESWARSQGRSLQVSYTLPTTPSGLESSGKNVLQNAVNNGARVDVVNLMTFDYYDGATHNMLTDAENAATGLVSYLATLYPSKTSAQRWAMVGITQMVGIDDYGSAETFQTSQAAPLASWASSKGVNTLSFWALQRDNGGCVGTVGSDSCSGVSQSKWQFSKAMEGFGAARTATGAGLSDPAEKEIAMKLVSSAENSSLNWKAQYSYIEDIGDGRGYTAGIIGFCSGTGDMLEVVQNYTNAEPGNPLAKYLQALKKVNGTDSHTGLGSAFVSAWKTAAKDTVFQTAQNNERDSVYFNPAVAQAKTDGLGTLGQFIYYDAMVMHGPGNDATSFGGIRARALKSAKTPAAGGNETTYLNAYLDARKWAMQQEEAHSDTSRVDTEQRVFLNNGNLSLTPPLDWHVYGDAYHIG